MVNASSYRTLAARPFRRLDMQEFQERSAYPHPEEFEVMRPEYAEAEDGYHQATITVAPFTVRGKSVTMAGARRAALYEAERTYRSYHPSYRVRNPFPDVFVDHEGVTWRRVPVSQRPELGDYQFVDADGEEDYADIENMLTWDVRPASVDEDSA
jgi:hypothetical protein